jgi:hypothetical protein
MHLRLLISSGRGDFAIEFALTFAFPASELADGEGFETPVDFRPRRFSRPETPRRKELKHKHLPNATRTAWRFVGRFWPKSGLTRRPSSRRGTGCPSRSGKASSRCSARLSDERSAACAPGSLLCLACVRARARDWRARRIARTVSWVDLTMLRPSGWQWASRTP